MHTIFSLRCWTMAMAAAVTTALPAQTPAAAAEVCGPTSLSGRNPLQTIHAHLCAFHFYNGEPKRTVRADHYCAHVNPDVSQCVIYDSDRPDARLIGIEYIISEALFVALPAGEKKLWHSHRYEVMSGQLTAPGLTGEAEAALMKEFVGTYGKTWHFWQVDRGDKLPLGLPKLMMGFTADGQADAGTVAARDRDLKIDTAAGKARRAGYATRPIAAGADAWERGNAFQIGDDLPQPSSAAPAP